MNVKTTGNLVVGAMFAVTFAAGVGAGYLLTKNRLRAEYEELSNSEIAEAKRFYAQLNKTGEYSDPTILAAQLGHVVEDLEYSSTSELEDDGTDESAEKIIRRRELTLQVVEEVTWNQEAEEESRSEDKPYVISKDEYFAAERDYIQTTITYYEGDDTLVDERDEPIVDTDPIVGDALERFGHGSQDNKIVYVRNERLEVDFEVVHSDNEYTKEVLGVIEHSNKRRPRKMRRDYE
jgi:hypothetical protein